MYSAQLPTVGLRITRTWVSSASTPNSVTNAYIRASCAYQISSGEAATKAAAISPVRRSNSSRPSTYSAGITSVPAISDGSRTASSPLPKTFTVSHSVRWCSGGWRSP